jgi:hypothetical protein
MSYRSRLVILKISPLDDTRVTKNRLIVSGNGSESCLLQRIQFRDVYQVKRFLNKLSENVNSFMTLEMLLSPIMVLWTFISVNNARNCGLQEKYFEYSC